MTGTRSIDQLTAWTHAPAKAWLARQHRQARPKRPESVAGVAAPAADDMAWWEHTVALQDLLLAAGWTTNGRGEWWAEGRSQRKARTAMETDSGGGLTIYEPGRGFPLGGASKLDVLAVLHHDGDYQAAGRAIREQWAAANPEAAACRRRGATRVVGTFTPEVRRKLHEAANNLAEREQAASPSVRPERLVVVAPPGAPLRNARLFLETFYPRYDGVHTLCVQGSGSQVQWYRWTGACWEPIEIGLLRSQIYDVFADAIWHKPEGGTPDFNPDPRKVSAIIDALDSLVRVPAEVQAPAWLPGCERADVDASNLMVWEDVILDMATQETMAHTPRLFSTELRPWRWGDRREETPVFDAWMASVWPDDPIARQTILEWAWYQLQPGQALKRFLVIIGARDSGKSLIGWFLGQLAGGDGAAVATELADLEERFGLLPIVSARVAIIGDSEGIGGQRALQRIKQLTGGDIQSAEAKGSNDRVTGVFDTKLVFISNSVLALKDPSLALHERIVALKMSQRFTVDNPDPAHRVDPHLKEKLLAEVPSIFAKVLAAGQVLAARGRFEQAPSSVKLVAKLKENTAPITSFIEQYCWVAESPECWVLEEDFCAEYLDWRGLPQGALSKKAIREDLQTHIEHFEYTRDRRRFGPTRKKRPSFEGIGLITERDKVGGQLVPF